MIIYKLTYYSNDDATIEYSTSIKELRQKIKEWESQGLNNDYDVIETIKFNRLSELCKILNKRELERGRNVI